MDSCCQIKTCRDVALVEQDKDPGFNTEASQQPGLFHKSNCKKISALRNERTSNLHRTMTIGISLYDGYDGFMPVPRLYRSKVMQKG